MRERRGRSSISVRGHLFQNRYKSIVCVHATLAGVLTAMMVPARSKCRAPMFSNQIHDLMARFDKVHEPGKGIMENNEQQAVLRGLENGVRMMETPLQRLEHGLHLWVAFLVLPVFALANAGIPMTNDQKRPPGSPAQAACVFRL